MILATLALALALAAVLPSSARAALDAAATDKKAP